MTLRMIHYSSRLIASALKYLGRSYANEEIIQHLRQKLSERDRRRFLEDARYSADWILRIAQRFAPLRRHG